MWQNCPRWKRLLCAPAHLTFSQTLVVCQLPVDWLAHQAVSSPPRLKRSQSDNWATFNCCRNVMSVAISSEAPTGVGTSAAIVVQQKKKKMPLTPAFSLIWLKCGCSCVQFSWFHFNCFRPAQRSIIYTFWKLHFLIVYKAAGCGKDVNATTTIKCLNLISASTLLVYVTFAFCCGRSCSQFINFTVFIFCIFHFFLVWFASPNDPTLCGIYYLELWSCGCCTKIILIWSVK